MSADVYEYRQALLKKLPKLGVFNGLGVLFLYAALWPWAVPPRIRKDASLAPQQYQMVSSVAPSGEAVEFRVASRAARKSGRYLASSDGKHWEWVCFVVNDGGWLSHKVMPPATCRRDVAGEVALAILATALLATISILVLNQAS